MTKGQRVKTIFFGVIMILGGLLFLLEPTKAYPFVTSVLSLGMSLRGVRLLIYYFTMAKHMVDGRNILYQGVLMIDLGLFTGALTQVPLLYVMLYLVIIHLFTGAIDILRALESRKYGGSWKVNLSHGVINVLMAVACLCFIKVTAMAVSIYALGLIYSGIMRIVDACRKKEVAYIQ